MAMVGKVVRIKRMKVVEQEGVEGWRVAHERKV